MSTAVDEKRPVEASDSEDDYSDSDYESEEEIPRQSQQQLQRAQQQQMQQQQQQQVAPAKEEKKSGGGAPSIRLDLNIELEVTLKARIHGDLTLALLT